MALVTNPNDTSFDINEQVSLLLKQKLGVGNINPGATFSAEEYTSFPNILAEQIWAQSDDIPKHAPDSLTNLFDYRRNKVSFTPNPQFPNVTWDDLKQAYQSMDDLNINDEVYKTLTDGVIQRIILLPLERTTYNGDFNFYHPLLKTSIPTLFDPERNTYTHRLYYRKLNESADPSQIIPEEFIPISSTGQQQWIVDSASGVLQFYTYFDEIRKNKNVQLYMTFFRYSGERGMIASGGGGGGGSGPIDPGDIEFPEEYTRATEFRILSNDGSRTTAIFEEDFIQLTQPVTIDGNLTVGTDQLTIDTNENSVTFQTDDIVLSSAEGNPPIHLTYNNANNSVAINQLTTQYVTDTLTKTITDATTLEVGNLTLHGQIAMADDTTDPFNTVKNDFTIASKLFVDEIHLLNDNFTIHGLVVAGGGGGGSGAIISQDEVITKEVNAERVDANTVTVSSITISDMLHFSKMPQFESMMICGDVTVDGTIYSKNGEFGNICYRNGEFICKEEDGSLTVISNGGVSGGGSGSGSGTANGFVDRTFMYINGIGQNDGSVLPSNADELIKSSGIIFTGNDSNGGHDGGLLYNPTTNTFSLGQMEQSGILRNSQFEQTFRDYAGLEVENITLHGKIMYNNGPVAISRYENVHMNSLFLDADSQICGDLVVKGRIIASDVCVTPQDQIECAQGNADIGSGNALMPRFLNTNATAIGDQTPVDNGGFVVKLSEDTGGALLFDRNKDMLEVKKLDHQEFPINRGTDLRDNEYMDVGMKTLCHFNSHVDYKSEGKREGIWFSKRLDDNKTRQPKGGATLSYNHCDSVFELTESTSYNAKSFGAEDKPTLADADLSGMDTTSFQESIRYGSMRLGHISSHNGLHCHEIARFEKDVFIGGEMSCRAVNTLSDRRKKENITKQTYNTETLLNQIDPYTFTWKDEANRGTQHGFIAQEIEQVIPPAVSTDTEGNKRVDYLAMISVLWKVCQEQQSQINDLKARMDTRNNA